MLGWLFGGSKAADKTVDSISNGLDKLVYTEEEKAEASQAGLQLWIEYQKATQPQNLARRLIALIIVSVWATVVLGAAIVGTWGAAARADFLLDLLFKAVMPSVVVIVSFYFYKRIADK